jgi:hypothetical protein
VPTGVTDQQQIAALREKIRRAGLLSRALRLGIAALVLLVTAGWILWQQELTRIDVVTGPAPRAPGPAPALWREGPAWAKFLDQWHGALAVGAAASLAALACLKIVSPWLRRLVLRAKLAALPDEQRAQVLRPLQQDRSRDTRKLASALARDLGLPTEVTPASAPGGRGDEVTET